MKYMVIKQYVSEFPNPITLIKGERVSIGEDPDPTSNPDTWVNWLYCIKDDGSNEGFVPEQIIECDGDSGTVLEDYTAKELDINDGEILEGIKELNGWLWCKKESTGELGWVPLENIEPIKSCPCPNIKCKKHGNCEVCNKSHKGGKTSYCNLKDGSFRKRLINFLFRKNIKKLPCLDEFEIKEAAIPYKGATERYIIDADDKEFLQKVVRLVADNTPLPKPKKKKESK